MALLQDRPWQRRLLGLTIGCLLLLGIEGLCRLVGVGKPDPHRDPFVSFAATSKLFTVDPLTNEHVTASERLKYFVEDRFPRKKATNTFRIFCLGGSTVQGRPYSIETAFSAWLEIGLQLAYPDRKIEVINCGGVSYASYRIIPILTECLAYEPDLFIICTGQNEFLEARTYAKEKRWGQAHAVASHFRLYHLLQSLNTPPPTETLKQEVDAFLDYQGGLQAYTRDATWKAGVQTHYGENLKRLISLTKAANVPAFFLRPPVNLKDCPPFKSDGPANDFYNRGQAALASAKFREAEALLWKAMEEDLCPLRLLPSMASDLERLCTKHRVPYLDLQSLLGKSCPQGILGDEILVDHVHPSIRGHQLIANALLDQLAQTLGPPKGDLSRRAEIYQAHIDSLAPLYYTHGQLRLRNLRLWTKGQTDGPRYQP